MSENKEETKVVEEKVHETGTDNPIDFPESKKDQRVKVVLPHQKIKGVVPQKKMPKQVFNKKPMTRSAGRGR
jgi:hypothetical protein